MLICNSYLTYCLQDDKIEELEDMVTAFEATIMELEDLPDAVDDLEDRVTALEGVDNPVAAIMQLQTDVTALQGSVTNLETLPAMVTEITADVTANCQKIREVTEVGGNPGMDNDAILTNILAIESNACA